MANGTIATQRACDRLAFARCDRCNRNFHAFFSSLLGKTTDVIINPVTREVTHIAIKDKHLPGNDTRLVPFSKVADFTHDRITLDCGKDEVTAMPPFIEDRLIAGDLGHDPEQKRP